jgi:hypothetical protein
MRLQADFISDFFRAMAETFQELQKKNNGQNNAN